METSRKIAIKETRFEVKELNFEGRKIGQLC